MNVLSAVIVLIVVVWIFVAVSYMAKNKGCGCGSDCSSCANKSKCSGQSDTNKTECEQCKEHKK
jgi:hypothetical protein